MPLQPKKPASSFAEKPQKRSNGLIWIASYPKSGNTWMRAFLSNLIAGGEEALNLEEIGEFCPSEANAYWYRPYLNGRDITEISSSELVKMRPFIQRSMLTRTPNHVPLKTHSQYGMLHNTPLIDANLSLAAIYIMRDPRDVLFSGMHHFSLSMPKMVEFMNNDTAHNVATQGSVPEWLGDWNHHVMSWVDLFPKKKIILRYEDLRADPVGEFSKVAFGLGITRDIERIKRAVAHSAFDKLKASEQKFGFSERVEADKPFFRSGKAGEWKEKLPANMLKRLQKNHGEMMERFGYNCV